MITKLWLAVMALILALLFLGYAFGAEWPNSPSWQRAQMCSNQMWSKVDYDPKLADPFFETEKWSYTDDDLLPPEDRPKERTRVMHTAKCFSTSFGVEHLVRFCKARLDGANTIQLTIYEDSPAFYDQLNILIEDGMFRCQYRTAYPVRTSPESHRMWTTKHQKLTLDKEVYRTGDEIKGRIEFECLEEPTHPKYIEKWGRRLTTIKVYGVFKAIVQSRLSAP
jgi:hypothetical protein